MKNDAKTNALKQILILNQEIADLNSQLKQLNRDLKKSMHHNYILQEQLNDATSLDNAIQLLKSDINPKDIAIQSNLNVSYILFLKENIDTLPNQKFAHIQKLSDAYIKLVKEM